jgi:hypothetical protein
MKMWLKVFSAKVGREDIFKPRIWNESLHAICNNNGVILVNFATYKDLKVKSRMFPHHNTHNLAGHLMERLTTKLTIH